MRALGQVDNAEWGRRAAVAVFVLPSLTVSIDATRYSTEFFNVGTGRNQAEAVNATLQARYELFSVRKFTDLGRSRRGARERRRRASSSSGSAPRCFIEADYYAVLQNQELARVARRPRPGARRKAWAIARARVVSGAAVQSDSLQLVLELTQARTDQLRRDAAAPRCRGFSSAGASARPGRWTPSRSTTAGPPELPIGVEEAVQLAVTQGPQYRAARANERAASAFLTGERGQLPAAAHASSGTHLRFDDSFFPSARNVSATSRSPCRCRSGTTASVRSRSPRRA